MEIHLQQKQRRWRSISSRKKEDGDPSPSQREKMEIHLHQNSRRRRWTSIKTVEEGDGPPSEHQKKEVDIRHHESRPPFFTNRIMIVVSCSSAEMVPSVNVENATNVFENITSLSNEVGKHIAVEETKLLLVACDALLIPVYTVRAVSNWSPI
jgi:hypothetical protein